MYLGAMLGLLYQFIRGNRYEGFPSKIINIILGLFVVAFAVDGTNSYLHFFPNAPSLYEPQNWLRLLTGTGMGLTIAIILFPGFNQTVWENSIKKPAIDSLKSFGILILIALLMDIIVLMEIPIVLYPLALISAAGVIVILTIVYAMLYLIIFGQENTFENFKDLWFPFVVGFGLALTQIALFDAVRYLANGTWHGFIIG